MNLTDTVQGNNNNNNTEIEQKQDDIEVYFCIKCKKEIQTENYDHDKLETMKYHTECYAICKDDLEERIKNACINVDNEVSLNIYNFIIKTLLESNDYETTVKAQIQKMVDKYGKNNSKEIEKKLNKQEQRLDTMKQNQANFYYVCRVNTKDDDKIAAEPEDLYDKLIAKYDKESKNALTIFEFYNETTQFVKPHLDFDPRIALKTYTVGYEKQLIDKIKAVLCKIFNTNKQWAIALDLRVVDKPPDWNGGSNKNEKSSMKISMHFVLTETCTEVKYLKSLLHKNLKMFDDQNLPRPDMNVYRTGINKFRPPYTKKSQANDDNSLMIAINFDGRDNYHNHLVSYTKHCTYTNFGIANLTITPEMNDGERHARNYNNVVSREVELILEKYQIQKSYDKGEGKYHLLKKGEFHCGETHANNHNYIYQSKYNKLMLKCFSQRCKEFCKVLYTPYSPTVFWSLKHMLNIPVDDNKRNNYFECKKYFERFFIHILDNNAMYRKDFKRIEGSKAHYMDLVHVTSMAGYAKKLKYKINIANDQSNYEGLDDKTKKKFPTFVSYLKGYCRYKTLQYNDNGDPIAAYESFYDRYLDDIDARTYTNFKFDPLPYKIDRLKVRNPDNKFNMFNGYGYDRCISQHQKMNIPEVSRYRFKVLMKYFRYNFCGLESAINSKIMADIKVAKQMYIFLLRYFRNIIEQPKKPPHLLITFFSEQGTGKSGMLKFIREVIGASLTEIYEAKTLGNTHFNKHVNKLLNIIEETDPYMSRKFKALLNSFSQRTTGTYNEKHQKETSIDVFVRFMQTTNYGVDIDERDRRYVIVKPDKIRHRNDYLKIVSQAEQDKYVVYLFGKFLETMVDTAYKSIKDWEEARPLNKTYYAMKRGNPISEFLIDLYENNAARTNIAKFGYEYKDGFLYIAKDSFSDMYAAHSKEYGNKKCMSKNELGKYINRFYNDAMCSKKTPRSSKIGFVWAWKISLKKLWYRMNVKEEFSDNYKQNDVLQTTELDEPDEIESHELNNKFVAISDAFNNQLDEFLKDYGGAPKRTDFLKHVPDKELVILDEESDDYRYGNDSKKVEIIHETQIINAIKNVPQKQPVIAKPKTMPTIKPKKKTTTLIKDDDCLGNFKPIKVKKTTLLDSSISAYTGSINTNTNNNIVSNNTWNTIHKDLPVQLSPMNSSVTGTVEFQIIDIAERDVYINKKRIYRIFVFGRTTEGKSICVTINDCRPRLNVVVGDKNPETLIQSLQAKFNEKLFDKPKLEFETKEMLPFRRYERSNKKFVTTSFDSLIQYNVANKVLRTNSYNTVNNYGEKYIQFFIEKGIKNMSWLKLTKYENSSKRFTKCQIELDASINDITSVEKLEVANFRVLSFDIETNSSDGGGFPDFNAECDKIVQISLVYYNHHTPDNITKICLNYGECSDLEDATIICCESEELLIIEFCKQIEMIDPDVLTGYNINGYDYEYIANRAYYLGIFGYLTYISRIMPIMTAKQFNKITSKDDLSASVKANKWSICDIYDDNTIQYGNRKSDYKPTKTLKKVSSFGRANIDLLPYYNRNDMDKLDNYKLETVSRHYLKLKTAKDDMPYKEIFRIFSETNTVKGTPDEKALVAKYCIQDSKLCCELIQKTNVLQTMIELGSLCNVTIRELMEKALSYKAYMKMLEKCIRSNRVIYDYPLRKEEYQGAIVIEPKRGFWNAPVSINDYSSLYPNSMVAFNICPSTLLTEDEVKAMQPNEYHKIEFMKPQMKYFRTTEQNVAKFKVKDDQTNCSFLYKFGKNGLTKTTKKYSNDIYAEIGMLAITKDSIKKLKTDDYIVLGKEEPFTYYFTKKYKGLLPEVCEELLSARYKTKAQMKDTKGAMYDILNSKQFSQKICVNTMYGVCGSMGKLSDSRIAEAITACGRNILNYGKTFIDQAMQSSTNIGGDTDSTFTKFQIKKHKHDCHNSKPEMDTKIAKILSKPPVPLQLPNENKELVLYEECKCPDIVDLCSKQALNESIRLASAVEKVVTHLLPNSRYHGGTNKFEYEKTYMPFLIFKKKQYVGMKYVNDYNGSLATTGVVLSRRDNCSALKQIYTGCLNLIMQYNLQGAIDHLQDVCMNLHTLDIKEFITSNEYKRKYTDYKTIPPVADLVRRLEERQSEERFYLGDRVEYGIVRIDSKQTTLTGRIETYKTIIEYKFTLDYAYYIDNMFTTSLLELFDLINRKDDAMNILKHAAKEYKNMAYEPPLPFTIKAVEPPPIETKQNDQQLIVANIPPVMQQPKKKRIRKTKPKLDNNRYALIDDANVKFRIFNAQILAYRSCKKDWKIKPEDCIKDVEFIVHLRTKAKQAYESLITKDIAVPWENAILCCDCRRTDIWRMQHYGAYKGNRTSDPIIKEMFKIINDELEGLISKHNIVKLRHDNCEGDDIIYMTREYIKARNNNATFVIVSSDSDFNQLLDDQTRLVSPIKQKKTKPPPTDNAQHNLLIKILMGDKSDNIPQVVSRCGEKTAIKIIKDTKRLQAIMENDTSRQQFELNKLLIDLSMIPNNIFDAYCTKLDNGFGKRFANTTQLTIPTMVAPTVKPPEIKTIAVIPKIPTMPTKYDIMNAKPVIKWVGGKTCIMQQVFDKFPTTMHNYFETFLGGGSVLINLLKQIQAGKIQVTGKIYASDLNKTLIAMYKCLQQQPLELFAIVDEMFNHYTREDFFKERDKFNASMNNPDITQCARFIYLNKHSFRGMYRENKEGLYAGSYGDARKKRMKLDVQKYVETSKLIKDVIFVHGDYTHILDKVDSKDDFIYTDPPYVKTFTEYLKGGFDHKRFIEFTKGLHAKGYRFLMSNSNNDELKAEFATNDYKTYVFDCPRKINASDSKDVLITNILTNDQPTKAEQKDNATNDYSNFEVSLANKYKESIIQKSKDEWFISRKYDGIRCVIVIDKEAKHVAGYTRGKKLITTIDKLTNELLQNIDKIPTSCVIDGELVQVDEHGNEDYTKIMKEYRRKNHTIDKPLLLAFDLIEIDDFYSGKSTNNLLDRYNALRAYMSGFNYIKIVKQTKLTDDAFEKLKIESANNEWEGLMLRKNTTYRHKRSNDILKVKKMQDSEFKVIGIKPHTKHKDMIGAIVIDYNNCSVGSGFTDEQRKHFHKNPNEIIGKIVTIKYFEKTKNSLRFPVFKGLHGDKRTT